MWFQMLIIAERAGPAAEVQGKVRAVALVSALIQIRICNTVEAASADATRDSDAVMEGASN